jgi:predicted RNase H-like HicB family nuclease
MDGICGIHPQGIGTLVPRLSLLFSMTFTAYIEYDPAVKLFTGIIPPVRGAHSQGATLELNENLKEVLLLCLDKEELDDLELMPQFVGLPQIEVQV